MIFIKKPTHIYEEKIEYILLDKSIRMNLQTLLLLHWQDFEYLPQNNQQCGKPTVQVGEGKDKQKAKKIKWNIHLICLKDQ